ncbi:sensor histidine kinase [Filimonas lacunae]|uniref:sensor histidine kinase n=1 Tax=Filimonas lacunae TaxID=477680 RepID=UPI0007D73895|nr:sensor histidine kinase [Filimonas lacunae]BAV04344.1 sensor histidine kinase [Filimonas lacunae]
MNNYKRTVIVVVLVCLLQTTNAYTQTTGPAKVVQSYSVAWQRLLAINTCQYLLTSVQCVTDPDSAMLYACRQHRLSRLLPYNEAYNTGLPSAGSQLIDSGYIEQADALVNHIPAGKQTELLLDLANYYLHQPTSSKADMDKAWNYLQRAHVQSMQTSLEATTWLLMGQYHFLNRHRAESDICFLKAEELAASKNNKYLLALICESRGKCQPQNSTTRLEYFQKSRQLFHQLNKPEKEIEILSFIIAFHSPGDTVAAAKALAQQLALENAMGYKHTQYNYDAQACMAEIRGDITATIQYEHQALQSMQYTGDTTLATIFYARLGKAYCQLGKSEEGIAWLQKAIAQRKSLPQSSWYSSFLWLTRQLMVHHSPQEAFNLMTAVSATHPPATLPDNIFYLQLQGECYQQLQQPKQADDYYTRFHQLVEQLPAQYPATGLPELYCSIAGFYIDQKNMPRSRQYINKAISLSGSNYSLFNQAHLEWIQFRLDSASGSYNAALQHHIAYTLLNDSLYNLSQRKQMDELVNTQQSEQEKHHLSLQQQQTLLKQAAKNQAYLLQSVILTSITVALLLAGLFLHQHRLKKRENQLAREKNLNLQKLAHENEWLLKQMPYHAKNHLQTMVRLLQSQSTYLQDNALLALVDSANRTQALSLIHHKLHQNDNLTSFNMQTYLPRLVACLKNNFAFARDIHFQLEIAAMELNISQAIPLVLIINEAVTNAIKYAFNDSNSHNEISITMQKIAGQQVELLIADNGKGLPPRLNSLRTNSMGTILMRELTEDMNGQFTISTHHGTLISVVFEPAPLFQEQAMQE